MGVDLRLYPLDFLQEKITNGRITVFGYSHTVINVPRNYQAWDMINKAPSRPLPRGEGMGISGLVAGHVPDGESEGEPCYGNFEESDSYGDPYRLIKAKDLATILEYFFPKHPTTRYVQALDPENEIVLGWH